MEPEVSTWNRRANYPIYMTRLRAAPPMPQHRRVVRAHPIKDLFQFQTER